MADKKSNSIEAYEHVEDLLQHERQKEGVTVENAFHSVLGDCYFMAHGDPEESPIREFFTIEDFEDLKVDEGSIFLNLPETGYGKFSLIEDFGRGISTVSLSGKDDKLIYSAQMDRDGNIRHMVVPEFTDKKTKAEFEDAIQGFLIQVKELHTPSERLISDEAVYDTKEALLFEEKHKEGVSIEKINDLYGEYYIVKPQNETSTVSSMFQIVDFEELTPGLELRGFLPEKGYGKLTFTQDDKRNVSTVILSGKEGRVFAVGQTSGDGKIRMAVGENNIQVDVNRIIQENPRDFQQFAQAQLDEIRNSITENLRNEMTQGNLDKEDISNIADSRVNTAHSSAICGELSSLYYETDQKLSQGQSQQQSVGISR